MKLILSHPTGNAFVRSAAYGFMEANMLYEFHTTIASFPGNFLDCLGAFKPFADVRRRRFDPALKPITRVWPWLETARMVSSMTGFTKLLKHETGPFCIDAVYQNLDKHTAATLPQAYSKGTKAVYSYEDGAINSFQKAKSLGILCIYDLPIGYWRAARRLLEKERLLKPEWASTLTGFLDSDIKLKRKDEELRLADRIFVASKFTANTLKDYPGKLAPIEVIPYGFPPVANRRYYTSYSGRGPLKLLFVGSLSQRKGIAELFSAVEALKSHVKLTVVGHKVNNDCVALNNALAKHRWIPSLPHNEILKLMQAHDVLVFPSLFEGFGLVITEAMSQGTPVITTDRTAGPDLIVPDQNGWIVEAGSSGSLQMALETLLIYPHKISKASKAALQTANLRPWKVYGRELLEAIIY